MSIVKLNHRPSINSLFDDFFTNTDKLDTNYNKHTIPAVNVKEHETGFVIELAVPGMKKEDLNIELENNKLSISNEKEHLENVDAGKYVRREFIYGKFQRTFNLPKNVEEKKIVGDYKDGILSISIPINKESKIAKKIASKSNLTIKIGKQAFYKQLEMPLRKAYVYTSKMMTLNMMAMDAKEGISAFLEKRKPKWKNK